MDLNFLHRHPSSLMRADAADLPKVRHAHRGLADGYASMIAIEAASSGATAAPLARRA